jgi:predicted amidohydrolase
MTGPASFKAACIQLRSRDNVADNIRVTSALIREAAGAAPVSSPPRKIPTSWRRNGRAKMAATFVEAQDPSLPAFAELAKDLHVWLLIGSLHIKVSETKTANRSYLFAPDGSIAARYTQDSSVRCHGGVRRELPGIQHRGRRP